MADPAFSTRLRVVEIGAVGRRVPLADLGAPAGGPVTFAVADDIPALDLHAPIYLNRPEHAAIFPAGPVARHARIVCSVRNGFLFSPFGLVVLPDGTLIRESALNLSAGALSFTYDQFKGQFPGRHILWSDSEETVLSLNGYSTNNYFHFLIDALAQVHWRRRLPAVTARLIVSGYDDAATAALPFVGQALQRAGFGAGDLLPFDGTLMFCRHVVFPARDTGANPAKVEALRELMGVAGRPRGRRRLYLSRPAAQRRRLLNDAEIAARLARHGFDSVDPGSMSFDRQVELFADAAVVVGPHGAALTNAVFMAPGGAVVELTHDARVVWTFHEVAGASGHAYACAIGDRANAADDPLFADFSVDAAAVEAAVVAALEAVR
jgi:hypothetical protein